jgi:cyclopropane-fatty-acyl-phospholipid synthase
LSNSATQRAYIEDQCRQKGFKNVKVITADMAEFQFSNVEKDAQFDRIMSVEMFEHMKNYSFLLRKVSGWLKPETGLLFVHIFAHKTFAYDFVTDESDSWMAKYFFTGGTMPSVDLFDFFQEDLILRKRWVVDGTHYRTCSFED